MDLTTMTVTRPLGFTLVELMVVLAILGALLAIGVPSYRSSVDSTRVATATNELLAALSLARMEAMRSTRQSIVCPSSNGSTCGTSWASGWMVASDNNRDNAPDAAVRYVQAREGMTLSVSGGTNANLIVFDNRGRPNTGGTNLQFSLQPYNCASGKPLRRTLSMTAAGQVTVQKGTCS